MCVRVWLWPALLFTWSLRLQHGSEINNVWRYLQFASPSPSLCVALRSQYSPIRLANCIRYILFMSCGNFRYHGIWWEWLLALTGLLSIFSVCLCLNFIEFQIVFSYMFVACCMRTNKQPSLDVVILTENCRTKCNLNFYWYFFFRGSLRYRQWDVLHVSYIKFIIVICSSTTSK